MSLFWWIIVIVISVVWLVIGISGMVAAGWPRNYYFDLSTSEGQHWLKGHLSQAKREVLILSNQLDPRVYTLEIVEIIKQLLSIEGMKVRILAGPEILTRAGKNPILELTSEIRDEKFRIEFSAEPFERDCLVIDRHHLFASNKGLFITGYCLTNGFLKPEQYKEYFKRKCFYTPRLSKRDIKLIPVTA